MLITPFSFSSKQAERKFTFFFLVLLFLGIAIMRFFDSFLVNEICTGGITSFELAKDVSVSEAILNSWNETAKLVAAFSTGFDYLFLFIYSTFIALLIHKLNERLWKDKPFYKFGVLLIYAQFLAALFDAIENVGMMQLLFGNIEQFWTSIAFYFATMKFLLIFTGISYILISFSVFLIKKIKK